MRTFSRWSQHDMDTYDKNRRPTMDDEDEFCGDEKMSSVGDNA